jgi:DNA repair exonuclease SbcCD nuclease subunit
MKYPIIKNLNGKRVWFITDTHLGIRNSSNEWQSIIKDYFFEWFFPLVRKNYKPGDVLIHCGDFYDSRQSINLKVLNLGVEVVEEMANIFKDGVYFIVGNHDIFGKNTNSVNSLKSIKWIPGITILEEPHTLVLGDKKFFMMPWRKDHKEEGETLDNANPHDFLCCHADIRGLSFNRYVKVETGMEINKFSKFTRVYSGHIHYAQELGNIKMLGSPYELTRSDMGNPKGITMLNLEDSKETFFLNDFSPRFKKYLFDQILEKTLQELDVEFKNNFIDIMIDPIMSLKAPLSILTDSIQSQRSINFHPYDPNQANNLTQQILDTEGRIFNVMDFINEYVKNMETDESTKTRIISSLQKLYTLISEQDLNPVR